ncbi:multiple cyclophane-containing RiPP AmcA, partial [Micromonospora sp. NPDC005367]|uniref:multiple cyclophane-containing RiPP AmcA n=1 Tax=Micromonospora sp. NPDC005367 TaxID=3155590 RepID=UPI0033A41A08
WGGAGAPANPPHTDVGTGRGSAMTVYVSRYAATGELPRDLSNRVEPVEQSVADLPLLTHVWRTVFEQQTRKPGRR